MTTKLTPLQVAILQALQAKSPPQDNALSTLFGRPVAPTNALADLFSKPPTKATPTGLGMFASAYPGELAPGPGALALLRGIAPKRKRRVFFSFHYQNDINRVNVVRQSWRFRPDDEAQPADWFDNSLWETAKKTGETALKRLINDGMNNTSVTCVLAGTDTWRRPWVRYEIAYALSRRNGLFGAYIDNVKCMQKGMCARGNNPFDHLGLAWDDDDKAYIWEKFNGQWRRFARLSEPVTWPNWLPNVSSREFIMPLSAAVKMYDYALDDGYTNLCTWANAAAVQAGR